MLLPAAALVLSLPAAPAAQVPAAHVPDDWPRWRGAHFDDTARAEGVFRDPFELRVRWRVALGSGYSAVSVRGAHAVTLAASAGSDWVVALDSDSGAERWRQRIGPAFPGQDGAADGPVSTPTLTADSVYALGPRGELVALALASGAPRWTVSLVERFGAPRPHWGFTTAPLSVGEGTPEERVIVAAGAPDGHAFVALDARDGSLAWHAESDLVHYASPILARLGEREVVLATGNTLLFALDPASGALLARAPHGGSDFYQSIVQPLALGDGAFLLKNQAMAARCVRFDPEVPGRLAELWSTRELSQNYNMAVTHDGLVFGHKASFLACVDAATGAPVWRSRPPGNGWVIGVDGHLVVLTKEGSLHVAPAGPDGYEERAALALFEHATWTPPSFARGRIYARDSLRDVACVEIVPRAPAAGSARAEPPPPRGVLAELARAVAAAPEPAPVVAEFLARQPRFPIVEDGRRVHFVFQGEAEAVVLSGDMLADERELPMERLAGTDLFWATLELEPDARVGYQFERDARAAGGEVVTEVLADPRNPRAGTALRMPAPLSELVMPAGEVPPAPAPRDPERAARLESFVLDVPAVQREGQTWGGPRRAWVHLPPGYAEGTRRYPVLYVNDGVTARDALGLPALLDALARAGRPTLGVLIEQQGSYELARGQQELYRDLLVARIVPHVDAHYRTVAAPEGRALLGFDEGAYAALLAALSHPDVFGAVGAQSLYHGSLQGPAVLAELVRQASTLPAVVLDWGRYDARAPTRALDVPGHSRALAAELRARGARVTASEANDGDTFAFWRARLPALLRSLLPPA